MCIVIVIDKCFCHVCVHIPRISSVPIDNLIQTDSRQQCEVMLELSDCHRCLPKQVLTVTTMCMPELIHTKKNPPLKRCKMRKIKLHCIKEKEDLKTDVD